MTVFFKPSLVLLCLMFCTPGLAQALKGPKACRAELRQHAAEIRVAKVKRRDFLAACRKTAVGQDTPIGDKPAPAPEAAAPPQPAPPAAEPAPQPAPAPPPPPPAAEPAPAPAPPPEAAKPREPDPKPAEPPAKPAAEAAPAEDHTLPGWWNWTMRLAAAAAIAVAALFAVRGLMRIRRAGG